MGTWGYINYNNPTCNSTLIIIIIIIIIFIVIIVILVATIHIGIIFYGVESLKLVELRDLPPQPHLRVRDAHAVEVLVRQTVLGDEGQVVTRLDEPGGILPRPEGYQPVLEQWHCGV